jgi:hypothetical protein
VSLCNIRACPRQADLVLYRCNQQHKSHSHSYIVNVVPHERCSSFIKSWKEKRASRELKRKRDDNKFQQTHHSEEIALGSGFLSFGWWICLFHRFHQWEIIMRTLLCIVPFFLNRFFLGRKNKLKQNYGTWNCFLLVLLLLLLEKRKRLFLLCVSDGWIFSRRNSSTGKNNNVRGCSSLSLSYYYFSFFQKNGLGQDEQLLTIRHCRIILCSLFITDKERYRLRVDFPTFIPWLS